MRRKIREISTQLARDEKDKLEAAGTFVDLERLTMEIGDELTRQLASALLSERAEAIAQERRHACPGCEKVCEVKDEWEPLILKGLHESSSLRSSSRVFYPRSSDKKRKEAA